MFVGKIARDAVRLEAGNGKSFREAPEWPFDGAGRAVREVEMGLRQYGD
jgi:hypothetical protein